MWRLAIAHSALLCLLTGSGAAGRDDLLKLDIPDVHGAQELYKAFTLEPKEVHIPDRVADLAVSTAAEDTRDEVDPFTAQCVHDFAQACPESWTVSSSLRRANASQKNGDLCEAPPSYKGDCKRELDSSQLTAEQKMLLMKDCKITWPCKTNLEKTDDKYCKDTERNFLQPCPENFLAHRQPNGYVCVPNPATYVGPCNSIVDFTNYSKESKMLWAQTCGATWPCMTICPRVFDDCPMDWKMAPDGACEAPISYNGPCEKRIHFTYYTQEMKRKRLLECDIPFECGTKCQKDYGKCPVLWKAESDGLCAPPAGAVSCTDVLSSLMKQAGKPEAALSRNVFDLQALDTESKKLFEAKCSNVEFPCMETGQGVNWSLQCPHGWTISKEDLRSCRPPVVSDDDVCKSQVIFNNEEEKRAFASLCQINWSASSVTTGAAPVKKVDATHSGPISDVGRVHSIKKTEERASEQQQRYDNRNPVVRGQNAPKEKTVSLKRRLNVLATSPYVVRENRGAKRHLFKGFTREAHLMPGST